MQFAIENFPDWILRPFIMSFLTTALAPTSALFDHGALLINCQGERFCDERLKPAYEVATQPEQIAYILIDARIATLFSAWPNFISTAPGIAYAYLADYRRNRRDIFTEADDLATLARKLKMDPAKLIAAVDERNAQIRSQPDASPPSLQGGPFVALGPVRAMFIHSEGGLSIDADMRVLGEGGQPIPGLLASGSNGQGGLLLKGHGHHLIWAFVSGWRAGRLAQAQPLEGVTPRR
jgi:fumarate reductase flavoprotein subunit